MDYKEMQAYLVKHSTGMSERIKKQGSTISEEDFNTVINYVDNMKVDEFVEKFNSTEEDIIAYVAATHYSYNNGSAFIDKLLQENIELSKNIIYLISGWEA